MMDEGSRGMVIKSLIPSGWEQRSFYDLARITSGQVDPRESPYRSMILIAPDHIRSGAGRIDERFTAEQQGAISGKYLVKKGEVIYSKIRPNLQKLALATEDCLCSADMYPVSAKDGVSPVFLKYLMLSEPFTEFATSVSVRSGMPKINREELAYFTTVVPKRLKEQEAVAEALSDAEALIEGLERLIAKKRLIKQGGMQELLTAKHRLPGFSGEWLPKTLGDLAHMKSGDAITSARITDDGAFPVFGGNGLRGYTTTFNKEGECTLVGRQGALCGAVVHTSGRIFASEHAIVCKATAGNFQRYLSHLFEFLNLNRISEASAQPGLSVEKIRKIKATTPPTEAEQERIARILDDMDAEIQALETRLEKARQLREGMMQNLLTGRIRLV
ncbi:restriction endonuclease subunit S [Rhizobium ruizarguesonis]